MPENKLNMRIIDALSVALVAMGTMCQAATMLETLAQLSSPTAAGSYSVSKFAAVLLADNEFLALASSPTALTAFMPIDSAVTLAPAQISPTNVKYHTVHGLVAPAPATMNSSSVLFFETELIESQTSKALIKVSTTPAGTMTITCGDDQMINVVSRIDVSDGVIYVIDQVMSQPEAAFKTIQLNGILSKWLGLLSFAKYDISQLMNVTFLVPNNDAVVQFTLNPVSNTYMTPEYLSQIIAMHVLQGILISTDLESMAAGNQLLTVNPSQSLSVSMMNNGPSFASPNVTSTASVVTSDLIAIGAIIHVIDQVLVPQPQALTAPAPMTLPTPANPVSSSSAPAMTSSSTYTKAGSFNTSNADGHSSPLSAAASNNQPVFPGDPNKVVWVPIIITILVVGVIAFAIWWFIVRGYADRKEEEYYADDQ